MRSRFSPLGGFLGGLLLALVVAGTVAAYAGQVAVTVEVSGPSGPQACNTPITVTARVEDIDGNPIAGQQVEWSFGSGSVAGDTILDTITTTDANGIATTQIQFACSPHSVTIVAKADDASGTTVLEVAGGGVLGTTGLPRTDVATESSFPAMALAGLAVLIGSGTILRRVASSRR